MSVVTVNFEVVDREHHEQISNDIQFRIRREIALAFEEAEFGQVIELPDSKFRNTFATPFTDDYFAGDGALFLGYLWDYPLQHGNFAFLMIHAVQRLYAIIRDTYRLHLTTRFAFS